MKQYLWLLLPLLALFPQPILPALLVGLFFALCLWLVILLAFSALQR